MSEVAPAGFLRLLRQREFGLLWVADAQSLIGDQLARVALVVLVFDRTRSGLDSAAVYALTFLPALAGSLLLGPVADRLPTRRLLVGGDLVRAGLLAVMALPGLSLGAATALLVVVVVIGTPWKAAERALVVELLRPVDYVAGTGLRTATTQAAQLLGFGLGGLAVGTIGAHGALAVDAATFAVSALVLRLALRPRGLAGAASAVGRAEGRGARWLDGTRVVLRDARLRRLLGLSAVLGLLVVPEGLAAPYAAALGGGSRTVGVLLAAVPAGVLVGSVGFSRWVRPARRAAAVGPLATIAGLPLLGGLAHPGLGPTLLLWFSAGLATAYQVQVVAEFVAIVPAPFRGQGISLASGALLGAQGIGVLGAGALVGPLGPAVTVALAGALAGVLGLALALTRAAHDGARGRPAAHRARRRGRPE